MIRPATPADVGEIHALVCELAEFENLRPSVVSTPSDFLRALFTNPPRMEALVADLPEASPSDAPDRLAGVALFYPTFSTFTGKPGLWLEDLYVRPNFRAQGIGTAFLMRILELARERNCARAEWSVLDWNKSAIEFYRDIGADVMPNWRIARVEL
ncbi:MAG: GNAT family N-acetyltransferase [Roseibacillus sp.]|nr:GNAT family N-acetyltransferase [Roseibacillus sp.]